MKITKNQLKELIRQAIKEIDFDSEEDFEKYTKNNKEHVSTS